MDIKKFVDILNSDFFTGVPDSQLKSLCDYLYNTYGVDTNKHIIGANEGNCVALAAGYHLATGKTPVVYMQNSGQGNAINAVASLTNEKVYGIPMVFVIGWRGEPGVSDEPQHVFQGEITLKLLDDLDIKHFVIEKNSSVDDIENAMKGFYKELEKGKSVAFVVKKGALKYSEKVSYENKYTSSREEIISKITDFSENDPIVCTTGKASRELFEIREGKGQSHKTDFLTVGSMGHSSSIALGITLRKDTKVWCIDGDGAALMHMGAMAVIGSHKPRNLVHIIINNEAHETVGGMTTATKDIDLKAVASACGYEKTFCVESLSDLDEVLEYAKKSQELTFIEIKSSIGARGDLGRPTTTTHENKDKFMEYLEMLN